MKVIAAILFVITASVCWAQEPKIQTRIANSAYWTAAGAAIGATTADIITTNLMVGRGHGCDIEGSNPGIYGRQPRPARTIAVMSAEVGIAAFVSYQAKKHLRGKVARLWSAPLVYIASMHANGAIHNVSVCR